jgi:HEAT repeat protein
VTRLRVKEARNLCSVAVLALLLCVGCPAPDGAASDRARTVLDERIAESAEFADFAFSLFGGADDPAARRWIAEALGSDSSADVRRALAVLGDAPPAEARDALQTIFATGVGTRQLQAAVALARLGDAAALGWLKEQAAVSGSDPGPAALEILATAGEEQLVTDLLRRRMDSEQIGLRNEAYSILGHIGQLWATRLLVEGLDREFGEERAQAVRSLGHCGIPEVAPRIEKLVGFQGLVLPSIESLGNLGSPSSVAVLEPLAAHEQLLVRAYAAVALWKLGNDDVVDAVLEPLLGADDPLVRRQLAEQLASVNDAKAGALLTRLARDADPGVRAAALRSLIDRPTAPDADLLLELAADPDYLVSTVALSGLASVGRATDVASIEPLLDSDNPYVAITAARALLGIQGREAGSSGI